MKHQKLTPKQCKEIVARVSAGEKQVSLARAYGVSEGLISRVVKREKKKSTSPSGPHFETHRDFSDWSSAKLANRRSECYREISEIHREILIKKSALEKIRSEIKSETEKLEKLTDDDFRTSVEIGIRAKASQVSHLSNTRRLCLDLAKIHKELSAILYEMSQREDFFESTSAIDASLRQAAHV